MFTLQMSEKYVLWVCCAIFSDMWNARQKRIIASKVYTFWRCRMVLFWKTRVIFKNRTILRNLSAPRTTKTYHNASSLSTLLIDWTFEHQCTCDRRDFIEKRTHKTVEFQQSTLRPPQRPTAETQWPRQFIYWCLPHYPQSFR